MICKNFSELSPLEKVLFIGELTHACMNEDLFFNMGKKVIEMAKDQGVFDNVKIMPNSEKENNDTEN
jgi:hypothetical protein